MTAFQSLPRIWLLSDKRNDGVLEARLADFSRASRVRLSPLSPAARRAPRALRCAWPAIARRKGHLVILSDSTLTAREWGADGVYGAPRSIYPTRADLLTIATAHDMQEIAQANRIAADAVMLSPVFPTRSHPGGAVLRPARFRALAQHAQNAGHCAGRDDKRDGKAAWLGSLGGH